ncbi:hypothetical protein ACLB2K_025560 [Fragaria x ananassa]
MTKKIEETPRKNLVDNKGEEVDQTKNKKDEVEKANASKCTKVEKSSSMTTKEKLEEVQKDKGVVEGTVTDMTKKIEEKSRESVVENKEKEGYRGIIEEVVHKKEKSKIEAEPIEIVVEKKLKEETTKEVGLKEEKENDQVGNADVFESGEVDKCSSLREEINSLLELNEHEKKALAELRSKTEKAIHENYLLKVDKDQAANEMKQEKETSQEVDDVEAKQEGISREGHPVHYSSFKLFGNEELLNKVLGTEEKRNVFIRSRIQLMERAIRKLDFKSGGVSSIFLVNDCKDMPGPSKKELRIALKQILTLHQDNYPEFVARHVHYALEELPVHYGGFRKENDPDFSTENEISEIFLNQSSTDIIRIPMQAGVSLMWEILVSGWEVNYKEESIPTDDGSYSVIIQRRKKISGHEGPIRNSFTCKEPGNIVLTIENGALIKKKRICYRYKMMNRSSS